MTLPNYPTSIGHSDADSITLLGHDLAGELMGQVGFGELAFWLVALRRPSAVIFDADGSMWIADTSNQRVRRVWHFLATESLPQ